jgi:heme/copper-type cytochrome/quinol oxidase subunit 3
MIPSPPALVNFEHPVVVLSGPYDYGMGEGRMMAAPAIAGGAVDSAAFSAPARPDDSDRASFARYGAALLIASWTMLGLAMYLAFIYLDGLNTMGQFKPRSEPAPSTLGNVLLAVGAIAAAAAWTWGYRRARGGHAERARAGVTISWLITLAGFVGSLIVFGGLNEPVPLHAYASSISLFVLFHAWHLLAALVMGLLVLGRLFRGRIGGREYVIQIVGWWLWYAAALSVVALVLVETIS